MPQTAICKTKIKLSGKILTGNTKLLRILFASSITTLWLAAVLGCYKPHAQQPQNAAPEAKNSTAHAQTSSNGKIILQLAPDAEPMVEEALQFTRNERDGRSIGRNGLAALFKACLNGDYFLVGTTDYILFQNYKRFTIVSSSEMIEGEHGTKKPDYGTNLEVFDEKGKWISGIYDLDRIQDIYMRRLGEEETELLFVDLFLEGTVLFKIDDKGEVYEIARVEYNGETDGQGAFAVADIDKDRVFEAMISLKKEPLGEFLYKGKYYFFDSWTIPGKGQMDEVKNGVVVFDLGDKDEPPYYVDKLIFD